MWAMLIISRRTRSLLDLLGCWTFLKMRKRWSRWSSKAEVQQWDAYPEPTELLLTGCLTEVIWIPRFKSSMVDNKHQRADILTKGNFTRQLFQLSLLRSEFQLDQLHGNDGEKDAKTERRQQDRGKVKADDDEPSLHCLDKFSGCAESGCVEKPGDTQSTLSNWLVKYRVTWCKRIQSKRSVEFSRMAKRCSSGCRDEETRRDSRRPGTPEFHWRFIHRFRKLWNRRKRQYLATPSP